MLIYKTWIPLVYAVINLFLLCFRFYSFPPNLPDAPPISCSLIWSALRKNCEKYYWSSSLFSFLQPHFTSSLLGPNIFLSTLFSKMSSLCFCFTARYQVSHPYKEAKKIFHMTANEEVVRRFKGEARITYVIWITAKFSPPLGSSFNRNRSVISETRY